MSSLLTATGEGQVPNDLRLRVNKQFPRKRNPHHRSGTPGKMTSCADERHGQCSFSLSILGVAGLTNTTRVDASSALRPIAGMQYAPVHNWLCVADFDGLAQCAGWGVDELDAAVGGVVGCTRPRMSHPHALLRNLSPSPRSVSPAFGGASIASDEQPSTTTRQRGDGGANGASPTSTTPTSTKPPSQLPSSIKRSSLVLKA